MSANPKLKDWQHLVALEAQRHAVGLFLGPVSLRVAFHLPRPVSLPRKVLTHTRKPDLDKLARAVLDALTGVIWRDDSQVAHLVATKDYAIGQAPSVVIEVEG